MQRRKDEEIIAEKRDDEEGVNNRELACEGEKVSVLETCQRTPHSNPTAFPPIHVHILSLGHRVVSQTGRQAVRGRQEGVPHTLCSDCSSRSDSPGRIYLHQISRRAFK